MDYWELLKLRNAIQDIDFDALDDLTRARQIDFNTIKQTFPAVDFHKREYGEFKSSVQIELANIATSLQKIDKSKRDYLEEISKIVRDETFDRITSDNIQYQFDSTLYRTAEFQRKFRQMPIQETTRDIVRSRIGFYLDWRYPALEIGPGDGDWTNLLVSGDPLYLIDYNDESLVKTKSQFNKQYQNRLRCYTNMGYGLNSIPQNQMGLVFSWNVFNFLAFEHIKHYLSEIYNVLRPGGACIFSYNNSERPHSAKRSDDKYMAFTPETVLLKIIRNIGFDDVKSINKDSLLTWVEFKKPGKLTSQRTGQTLGKIIPAGQINA